MTLHDAQREMRSALLGGFAGQLIAGLIWAFSALFTLFGEAAIGIALLFFGSMAIFPLTQGLLRLLGRPARVSPANGLWPLGMQIAFTVPLNFLLVFAAAFYRADWFYPAAMIVVGAHYLPLYHPLRHAHVWPPRRAAGHRRDIARRARVARAEPGRLGDRGAADRPLPLPAGGWCYAKNKALETASSFQENPQFTLFPIDKHNFVCYFVYIVGLCVCRQQPGGAAVVSQLPLPPGRMTRTTHHIGQERR
jgi:hypothetical protein